MEELTQQTNTASFRYFPFFKSKQPYFILALLALLFYVTTLNNEYALDDSIVIHQNDYVLKGVKGIPDILTNDQYHSFYERMNAKDQLMGGRYRPFPTMTFALEQEFIGTYRTGHYFFCEDLNKNGELDKAPVSYTNKEKKKLNSFEYNESIDANHDGITQSNECKWCWDRNENGKNDYEEDRNQDGVYNEIDCQVYGASFRHLNNVLLYLLLCLVVYAFLKRTVFASNQDMAFLGALLFLIHPVHTEVVANVKGREDIVSLLFILLSLLYFVLFVNEKKKSSGLLASLFLFLALLSKEYALLMLFIVPLTIYFFKKSDLDKRSGLLFCAFLLLPFGIYLILRASFVNFSPGVADTELLNNSFLLANGQQAFASQIHDLLVYLRILFLPHPLVCDYSYEALPYNDFSSWKFWLALILNGGLLIYGIRKSKQKHVLAYGILFYFIFLLPVSNLFFNTGIRLLEANLFHASFGFSIALAWLIIVGLEKMEKWSFSKKRNLINTMAILLIILTMVKTWERNWDWKNDVTLFMKDVKNSPNSVLILGNAGARWIDLADTKEITGIAIPGQDPNAYNDYNGVLKISDEELKASGAETKREYALRKGMGYLERAVELHPRYVNGFLNLGLAAFKLDEHERSLYYWKHAEYLYPDNPYLKNYYTVVNTIFMQKAKEKLEGGDYKEAEKWYKYCKTIDENNAAAWRGLEETYKKMNLKKAEANAGEKACSIEENSPKEKQEATDERKC